LDVDGRLGPITRLADGRVLAVFGEGRPEERRVDASAPQRVLGRFSSDHGRRWSEPKVLFTHPPGPGASDGGLPLGCGDGTIHIFGNRYFDLPTGPNRKAADYFRSRTEMWHAVSRDGGSSWDGPKNIEWGHRYTGAMNSAIQLKSGRILVPFSYLSHERSTGFFVCDAVYSDDAGKSWRSSRNDIAIDNGGRALESGAVEPVTVELDDGRVWMVIRTQTGYLFESFSDNAGESWSPPQRTIFRASNAPAGVLRLGKGRLALIWNNEIGEPFRHGLSYSRQSLVMAIREGGIWRGYRELAPPFGARDDQGSARYPYAAETADGAVLVGYPEGGRTSRSIQAADSWRDFRLVRVDPSWLLATEAVEDFTRGIANLQLAGTEGVRVAAGTNGGRELFLQKPRADRPAGATWNFPFGRRGELRAILRVEAGFAGAFFDLSEYFLAPANRQGGAFRWMIGPDMKLKVQYASQGPYLETGPERWTVGEVESSVQAGRSHELSLRWNCDVNVAELRLDGRYVATFAGIEPARGMNYLRLSSAAAATDAKGLRVVRLQSRAEP
jgi:hypothetical protein